MGQFGVDIVLPFPPGRAQAQNPKFLQLVFTSKHVRFDLGSFPFRRPGPGLKLLRFLIEVLLTT